MTSTPISPGGVAVVTGAGSGIGRALAHRLAEQGMKIAVLDRDGAAAEATVAALPRPDDGAAVAVDVTDPEAMHACAARVEQAWGPATVLCNNAGVLRAGTAWTTSAADWELTLGVNVRGVANGLAAFLPSMISAGRPAHVVNIASIGGLAPAPGVASYVASKFAVVGLTENLRLELTAAGHHHVAVSVVCPGGVATDIWRSASHASTPSDDLGREVLRTMGQARPDQVDPAALADLVVHAVQEGRFWVVAAQESLHERVADRHGDIVEALHRDSPTLYRA